MPHTLSQKHHDLISRLRYQRNITLTRDELPDLPEPLLQPTGHLVGYHCTNLYELTVWSDGTVRKNQHNRRKDNFFTWTPEGGAQRFLQNNPTIWRIQPADKREHAIDHFVLFRVKGGDVYEIPTVGYPSIAEAESAALDLLCLTRADVYFCYGEPR